MTGSPRHAHGARLFDAALFAEALKFAVAARGLPYSMVERESGVSASALCQAIQGKRGNPSLETFARLCRWMRVPIGLFFREGKG